MMDHSGVYVIRNLVTGKSYVGSSIKVRARMLSHKSDLRKDRHSNAYLSRAWLKYGEENFKFEVLEKCSAKTRLIREQWWIEHLRANDERFGYNLIPTRESQSYGPAIAKYQRAGWAKLTAAERRALTVHLQDPKIQAKAKATLAKVRQSAAWSAQRRELVKLSLCTEENREGNSKRLLDWWSNRPGFREARLIGLARGRAKTNARTDPEFLAKRAAILAKGRVIHSTRRAAEAEFRSISMI